MTDYTDEKYSRLRILPEIGLEGQKKIAQAKIGVFGLGGLGSWSSLLLSQMGVGFLRIVDRDIVELSNLSRTPIYTTDSVDLPKAEQAKIFLQKINPSMIIEEKITNIDETTITDLVKDLDIIIDGLDNVSARLTINQTCKKYHIPYIFAGAIATSANISTFTYKENHPCLNCVFETISDDELEKCDVLGVHTSLLAIVASIQVAEAVRLITKKTPIFDSKLGYLYLETMEIDHIPFKQNKDCQVCFSTQKTAKKTKRRMLELCGNKTFLIPNSKGKKINLEEIISQIKKRELKILKQGSLGLTFKLRKEEPDDILVSIFANGNVLIRGESDSNKAKEIQSFLEENIF